MSEEVQIHRCCTSTTIIEKHQRFWHIHTIPHGEKGHTDTYKIIFIKYCPFCGIDLEKEDG